MISRRKFFSGAAALLGGSAIASRIARGAEVVAAQGSPSPSPESRAPYLPVVTPNGSTLPWKMVGGVKEFHLVAEPVKREFAPGMIVNCWGYNGQTPGPTIEAVEGERVRILVTNKLPEPTSVHWHGFILPNGMDGVGGVTQKHIQPGETYAYEFPLVQHGAQMYHPHSDEMTQMAMGMQGFFIIHPKDGYPERIDRHFCIFLQEWSVEPGTFTPNPNVMTDFNLFTFNSRVFPGTDPLVVKLGDRVRVSIANLSMDSHPIHFHGHRWWVVETDGGPIPKSGWWPEVTVNVPPGTTRTVEFVADNPGDWAFHCHKNHHAMNAMNHNLPNMIGVNQEGAGVSKIVPGSMAMGSTGMSEMGTMHMGGPKNTLPMMTGDGPFGPIEMGGMFTILKVRAGLTSYDDPGWYQHPQGEVATLASAEELKRYGIDANARPDA
ncbi:MAG: copper oxidase [Verrucomicrobiota bacterium]|nr:copper oxidase [Verrucomicrobiota bacterium]